MTRSFLLTAAGVLALALPYFARANETPTPLDQPAAAVTFTKKQTLTEAFFAIGRAHGIAFVVEPDVTGSAELDLPAGSTVREVLDALVYPGDLFYEEEGNRVIVRQNKTVIYRLFVPGNTRTSSSQTNITLTSSSQGQLNAQNGTGNQQGTTNTSSSGAGNGGNSSVQIAERNENPFWDSLQKDVQVYALPHEKITINPNSSRMVVATGPRRQKFWQQFIDDQNEVLTRQVDIDVRILTVDVNAQHKLGVDLNLATIRAGGTTISDAETRTGFNAIGPAGLGSSTSTVTLSSSRVTALITALQEQGEVRSIAKPQVRVMNNQMAYLVVGQEEGFFSVSASIDTTTNSTGNTSSLQSVFSKETLTFGTIFTVTANIPTDRQVILDVKPERSSLVRTKTSPDGKYESPVTTVEKAGTRLMLQDGETVVLAGLSSVTEGTKSRGVPGASKVPLLGHLFRTDARANTKTELVIIITARICKPATAAGVAPTPLAPSPSPKEEGNPPAAL